MKGTTALCPTCGTSFIKKTHHHIHCKTGCRVRNHRKKHGIPEPDFSMLKRNSAQARLEREEAEREHRILDLIKELEELEQFHPSTLRWLTHTILKHPTGVAFYGSMTNSSGVHASASASGFSAHMVYMSDVATKWTLRRCVVTDRDTGKSGDTDTLPVWKYLTEDERQIYIKYVVHYGRAYQDTMLKTPFPDAQGRIINMVSKRREDLESHSTSIIERVKTRSLAVQKEIDRQHRFRTRRMNYLGQPTVQTTKGAVLAPGATQQSSSALEPLIITTAAKLEREHILPTLPLPEPFASLMGKIPFNPYIVLWGDAGSGKTGFTLRFLKALIPAQKVALCTAEASLTSADSPLVALAQITNTKKVPLVQTHSIDAVERILGSKQFTCLAIDSASRLELTPDKVKEWRKALPTMMMIVLLESTKGGKEFKGDNMWKHHCNMMIRAELVVDDHGIRTQSRYVVEKNQYGTYGDLIL
jgi:hypothetical protein